MSKNVTLSDMLRARESRTDKQQELLKKVTEGCVVSLTINMPGPIKANSISEKVFKKGLEELLKWPFNVVENIIRQDLFTGPEAFFILKNKPDVVKRYTCNIEEKAAWTRLLDIDVIDKSGYPLAREDFGFQERTCIVCGEKGTFCASRRLHTLAELNKAVNKLAGTI